MDNKIRKRGNNDLLLDLIEAYDFGQMKKRGRKKTMFIQINYIIPVALKIKRRLKYAHKSGDKCANCWVTLKEK